MKKEHFTLKRFFKSILVQLFPVKTKFEINRKYNHQKNVPHFNDTENKDLWQDEVYSLAKLFFSKNNCQRVIDIGCGSGYKLIKYFKDVDFVGFDVEPTVTFLNKEYETYQWKNVLTEKLSDYSADIVISSDVIEHIENPIPYIENMLSIKNVKYYFISTPERFSLYGGNDFGPPSNIHHFREWSAKEFYDFMSNYFDIEYHIMSNFSQHTQLIIAKKKK